VNDTSETTTARRDAEEALLGSLLIEATSLAVRHVQSIINHADFFQSQDRQHSRIFQAMTKCDHVDEISVALKMQELGLLRKGDCGYLRHLISETPNSLDYLYYAKAVRRYSRGDSTPDYQGLKIG